MYILISVMTTLRSEMGALKLQLLLASKYICMILNKGPSKINGAKLSDARYVRANWLCMGWSFCLAEMRREFQTGGNFFCTTL